MCEFVGFISLFCLFSCLGEEEEMNGLNDNEILIRKNGAGIEQYSKIKMSNDDCWCDSKLN